MKIRASHILVSTVLEANSLKSQIDFGGAGCAGPAPRRTASAQVESSILR